MRTNQTIDLRNMGPIKFGPKWFWDALITLALVGIVASGYFLVKTIIWIIQLAKIGNVL